jgi:hypothetical protein
LVMLPHKLQLMRVGLLANPRVLFKAQRMRF